MASCYICGCSIRSGEGYRRKVLVSESARIYFTKHGGGSYGQSYALRTLCYGCASELDSRNRSLAWKLPVSLVMAVVGVLGAMRYAVNSDSSNDSALESLIYAFFLFGGLGLLTFIILSIFENINSKENIEESQHGQESEQIAENHVLANSRDSAIERIITIAKSIESWGISLYGCYSVQRQPENFPILVDKIIQEIPIENYSNLEEWESVVQVYTLQKFLNLVSEATNPIRIERLFEIYPQSTDEPLESYTERISQATSSIASVFGKEEIA